MPIDAYDASLEYDETRYEAGVTPKVDGSVELTPDNFIEEENMRELSADGAPPGWDAVRGPKFEGWVPYISSVGGARGTLQKQLPGGSPLPPEQDVHPFATPIISGGQAPTRSTPGAIIPATDLEAPVVSTVAATKVGFPQGVYGAAITLVGRGGSHTLPTDEGPVVTVSSNGKRIEFNLLTDADRELVRGQGLWLTAPAATEAAVDWTTLRLQDIAPNRGRTYTLNGPYKWNGRLAPKRNETAIGKPERFRYRRDYRLRGRLGKDLQAGEYLFYRVESTRVGDSEPSPHGPERQINADKKDHGYVFSPKKLHPEAIGYKIFVQDKTDGLNPPFYQLMRVRRGDKARYFNREEEPVFFGIKDAEMAVTAEGEEKDKSPERSRYVLVQADPPTEDASGLENPSGEIDPPVAVDTGRPAAGTYLVGYTKMFSGEGIPERGGETPLSPLSRITITDSQVIQMQFPPRVNKIANALYGQLDQAGLPINWEIRDSANAIASATSADIAFERAGVLYLQATALANAGVYPNATQPAADLIAVDKDRIETIAGYLEVTGRTSGSGYVELIQYDDTKTDLSSNIRLATMSVNGKMWVEKTVAGSGLGADHALSDSAAYVGVRWGAEGNPRTLRVRWHSQVWAPFDGVPRRFEPEGSPLEHSVASNDPATPYPSSHVLKVGSAPDTAADVAASAPPLEIVTYDALAAGAEPTGWTQTLTNATEAGAYVSTVWGDTKTYRVRSENTGAKSTAGMAKTFTPSGNSLAALFRVYIERGPTRNPSSVHIGYIRSTGGQDMARLKLKRVNTGTNPFELWLVRTDADNKTDEVRLRSGLKNTDLVEVEMLVGGGDTTAGAIATSIGVNGATRSPGTGLTGIDYTNRSPVTVRQLAGDESHSDTKWTIQYGELVITEAGYVSIENTAPALTAIPQPDVPLKDGTTLSTSSDYTHGSTLESMGAAVTVNRSGTLAATRTLAKITDSAGTTELARVQMKTDSTVEVVVKNTTTYSASAAVPTGTDYRFGLVVEGAGTSAGTVLLYRTISGARELYVQQGAIDFTGLLAQRATVPDNTELTESSVVVSEHGEYEYDTEAPASPDADPDDPTATRVYQEYVSVLPADVVSGQENMGFDVEEFFVKPDVQRTAAVYMRAEDLPTGAAPFTIVEYDDDGVGTDLVSVYADGTGVVTPGANGWYEYWTTYTPTQKRVRWEHRGMTGGRYVAQRRLDAVGNLTTKAARDAMRDGGHATSGIFTAVLNARIPSQTGTQFDGMWLEERVRLGVVAQTPTGTSVTARYRSAATEVGLAAASWQADPVTLPDLEWVEVEATLTGDGSVTPTVPSGGVSLFYKCFQPVLLRDDRSALPGGVYIGGGSENNLARPYRRSLFDTEAVGDRAAPRAITARIGRLDGFPVSIFTPEALDELQSDDLLSKDWYIESPYHDLVMRVRFYGEPSEAVTLVEYPLLDEGRLFWSPVSIEVERAEVVEAGPLV